MKTIIFQISAILIVAAAIIFDFAPHVAKFVLAIGTVGYAGYLFTTPYPGKSIKGKRMYTYQIFSSILFVVSAYLMFVGRTEWVYTLLAGALLTLYCAIVIPRIFKKEQKNQTK